MDATSTAMSKNWEGLGQPRSKLLSSTSWERKWTALCQFFCGVVAFACGLTLRRLKLPTHVDGSYIRRLENASCGVWGGMVFIATAVSYMLGRKNRTAITLYCGCSVLSVLAATAGLALSVLTVSVIIRTKASYLTSCPIMLPYDTVSRCFERCSKPYLFSDHGSQTNATLPPPDCSECDQLGQYLDEKYEDCLYEIRDAFQPHLIVLGILLAFMSIELFTSNYSACAAIFALRSKHMLDQYYPYSFSQLESQTSNDVIVQPTFKQHQGPGITTPMIDQPTANILHVAEYHQQLTNAAQLPPKDMPSNLLQREDHPEETS